MSLFTRLRCSDQERQTLMKLHTQLPGCSWVERKSPDYYLSLIFINEKKQQLTTYLDMGKWLSESDNTLPGLSWLDIPEAYLFQWLNNSWNNITLLNQRWELSNVCRTEEVTTDLSLAVPVNGTMLLISSWPDEEVSCNEINDMSFLKQRMDFVIGNSTTTASVVSNIENGDLLLIDVWQPRAEVGDKVLANIRIDEEFKEVVMSNLIDCNKEYNDSEDELYSFDWGNLPVTIKYVLSAQKCTLSELESINAGSVFPLPTNAEKNVKVYVNDRLFAFGELVTVDDQDLAVEIHTINKLKPNTLDVDNGNE